MRRRHDGEQASVRTILLVVVWLLIGIGLGGLLWRYWAAGRGALKANDQAAGQEVVALSAGTKAVLRGLDSPVEIRFYALLEFANVSESVQALAGRVDQLLSAYQQEAGGKVKVTRYNSRSDSKAAAADGIKPFNVDKGDACYLGLAVVHAGQKELLPLAPEWERALESDLSRAITRVVNASPAGTATGAVLKIDPVVTAEVKRQIPNFASVSLEEGTRVLRESALKDFKTAVSEMEIQVREAQQRLSQAQAGKSEAEQQAAMKELQRVRADHAEKLKEIAAGSSAQIEALRQLKEAPH
jgi:hypothetical protein